MADYGAVGTSLTLYTEIQNASTYTGRYAGVSFTAVPRGSVGVSLWFKSAADNPPSYTTRLAGAGGSKGTSPGGGGGGGVTHGFSGG